MDKLMYEIPTIERKQDAIEYINEFYKYNSAINGVGGLYRYLENYEGWLLKIEQDSKIVSNENKVPSKTFFLVRESDNKIIGMINIRLSLNEKLKKIGGHIGYSIRPTERKKGYNKINLYLGLLELKKYGIKEALLTCDKDNLGSSKTMMALDGNLVEEFSAGSIIKQKYIIQVDETLEKYKATYENYIDANYINEVLNNDIKRSRKK